MSENNLNGQEDDKCEKNQDDTVQKKLRGDAIGDTVFSETFVLKTLLRLSEEWSEDLEGDLCYLWDMTVEEDVCKFLLDNSFIALACDVLLKTQENRLTEIIVGILTNIITVVKKSVLTEQQLLIILLELDTTDHLILIQVARFIIAVSYVNETCSFISSEVLEKILFILNNSTNIELLLKTLEVVSKLTVDCKLDPDLITIEILKAVLVAYKTILTNHNSRLDLDIKEHQLAFRYLIETITNICGYINCNSNSLLPAIKENSNIVLNEIIIALKYYKLEENLLPVTDEAVFYYSAFSYIFQITELNFIPEVVHHLFDTFKLIVNDVELEIHESILECICYFVGKIEDFVNIDKLNLDLSLLKIIHQKDIQFEFSYKDKLNTLIQHLER